MFAFEPIVFRRAAKAGAALAALLAVNVWAGCMLFAPAPYTIVLASVDERLPRPRFTITQRTRKDAPRFYSVDLWDRENGIRSWRALSNSLMARPTLLVYGELEGEWKVEAGPTPLQEGKRYILEIVGEGDANIPFRVEPGGRLVEDE